MGELITAAGADLVLASSGGSDGTPFLILLLLAAGPAAGVGVWAWIQARYRNRSARYRPQDSSHHRVVSVRQDDAYVRRLQTSRSSVDGRNESRHDQRAQVSRVYEIEQPSPPSADEVEEAPEA